jgi:branched-chain amino acid transport system substrate-binding protein
MVLVVAGCGTQRDRDELLGAGAQPAPAPATGTETASETPAVQAPPVGETGAPDSPPAATTGSASAPSASGKSPAASPSGGSASGSGSGPSSSTKSTAAPRTPAAPTSPSAGQASAGAPGASTPGPTPGAPSAAATPGANRDPLRVGILSTLSGPIGATLAGGTKGAQAWAAYINAAGGANGHPVELTLADDGADPARNRAQAQYLVEQKKAVAILMSQAPVSGQGSVSYFQEKRVPVVGSEGGSPWVTRNSMYFPQLSSDPILGFTTAHAMGDVLVPQGKKKIALIYCVEIQGCANLANEKGFTDAGMEVVYKASVSLAAPDFTAQCLGARNAGAQSLAMFFDTQSVGRLADNCASVGYKPVYGHPGQIAVDGHLKNPNLDGDIVGFPTAPWFDGRIPGIADFKAAMARFAPNVNPDGSAVTGWAAGKLLERASRNLGTPTSQGILEGLWSIQNDDLDGITAPLTFRKDAKRNGDDMQLCYWIVRIDKGKWTSPGSGDRRCKPWDKGLL